MLSIIFLSYNSGNRILMAYDKLSEILNNAQIPFEFIIMDDGSGDNSYEIALEAERKYDNISAYCLSKNFTSYYSMFAGLSVCKGGCAMPIADDEQLPYYAMVDLYRLWQNGEKVIIPHRSKRNDGFFTNLFANTYYKIINSLSEIKFPKGGADSFLIDREVIDILNKRIHPRNTTPVTETLRLGFNPKFYPYERVKGINTKSRWTFRKKVRLFKDTFFTSSTWPIKTITRIGFLFSVVSVGIILFYSYIRLFGNPDFWGESLPGWTSTVVIISFFLWPYPFFVRNNCRIHLANLRGGKRQTRIYYKEKGI